jgi:hypothetical protein
MDIQITPNSLKKINEFLHFANFAKLMYYFSCTARMEKRHWLEGKRV